MAGMFGGMPHALAEVAAAPEIAQQVIPFHTLLVPPAAVQKALDASPAIILTDQYAPVDNLMADVFRYRYRARPRATQPETPDPPKDE